MKERLLRRQLLRQYPVLTTFHSSIRATRCFSTRPRILPNTSCLPGSRLPLPQLSRQHEAPCLQQMVKMPWSRFMSSQAGQPRDEESALLTPQTPTTTTLPSPLRLSSRPHENIYTLPNFLTFTRLLAAPAVGYLILTTQPHFALALFAYAGLTDMVDGYLARRYNSTTVVGTVIDPMADKALMTICVVCLAYTASIPLWTATIILGRDVALAISAIYFRWISLPPPKTMARYWDFSLPSAEVHPTEISKINTFLQILFVGSALTLPVLPEAFVAAWNLGGVYEGFQYLVAGTTFWSGASYIYSKDAVKILTHEEIKEKMEEGENQQQPRPR